MGSGAEQGPDVEPAGEGAHDSLRGDHFGRVRDLSLDVRERRSCRGWHPQPLARSARQPDHCVADSLDDHEGAQDKCNAAAPLPTMASTATVPTGRKMYRGRLWKPGAANRSPVKRLLAVTMLSTIGSSHRKPNPGSPEGAVLAQMSARFDQQLAGDIARMLGDSPDQSTESEMRGRLAGVNEVGVGVQPAAGAKVAVDKRDDRSRDDAGCHQDEALHAEPAAKQSA